MSADEKAIWHAMLDIYAGAQDGDTARIDRHLHADATLWDTDEPELAVGLEALAAIRARRPATAPDLLPRLRAEAPLITVWGATALLRHVLTIEPPAPAAARTVRNTSVWRRHGERWLLVHNHEDVIADP
ncbi:nuclear transport factor 2 family protein [Streptomyces radicis]|uniref:DUF4440 domain-containing protein n=1 Tax=Streptomyces radicis TaxID=1750517 RepID=A0A3A9WXK7_9ACTN|nr:nuclear transport factor 2 family protein [Streptomyces radicis]RKN10907.1 DUF4440 domain-containing protein [Streptomyces radicis]RKN25170.1 DUF4440 domain-containing protein [Streptomyces radicis]